MSIRMRLREERAQATVEIAVVTPVLLVLALIVYNVMIYASAVARFDRVVPDIVLAHAVAPSGEGDESSVDASATVRTQILNAMEGYDLQIEVSSEQGAEASDGGLLSYPVRLGPTPAPCTMSRGRLLSASLAFRWGRRQRCRTSAR